MANNVEEQRKMRFTRDGTKTRKSKTKIKKTGPGTLKALFKHLVPFIIPFLAEGVSGGILPGNTGFVLWTYREEKKAGKAPNLGEYLAVGIPAVAVDAIGLLSLTGVFLIFSYAITGPCLGALFIWRIFRHGFKGPKPIKIK